MEFLGRKAEAGRLRTTLDEGGSRLIVLYGRRRVGKTRLIEEAFRSQKLLLFEGLEGQPTAAQQKAFLEQLAKASGQKNYERFRPSDWTDILILLSNYLGKQKTVVLFDEFQWLAAERTQLVSHLKYCWDNYFAKKNNICLILCGSISSFLVKKVIQSKALYGRVDLEMHLQALSIQEIKTLFHPPRSAREWVEIYLCMGGIPQYLKMVDPAQSARRNIERLCFSREGYLVHDFDRIFVSHFGKNRHYKDILLGLAAKAFRSREDLQKICRLPPGGRLSRYLEELELADFIEGYPPVHKPEAEKIKRFRLSDPYLLFYFRFIYPHLRKIKKGGGEGKLSQFVSDQQYAIWQGLAFEQFCYCHHSLIAEKLGFGAVRYECGPWFRRADLKSGAQIDMLFIRADRVLTLCEIKFQSQPIGKEVLPEVEKKAAVLKDHFKETIEKVLITASPPSAPLLQEGYFNRALTLEELVA